MSSLRNTLIYICLTSLLLITIVLESYKYPGFWYQHTHIPFVSLVSLMGSILFIYSWLLSSLRTSHLLAKANFILFGTIAIIGIILLNLNTLIVTASNNPQFLYLIYHLDSRAIGSVMMPISILWAISAVAIWDSWGFALIKLAIKAINIVSWFNSKTGQEYVQKAFSLWSFSLFIFCLLVFAHAQQVFPFTFPTDSIIKLESILLTYSLLGAFITPQKKSLPIIFSGLYCFTLASLLVLSRVFNPVIGSIVAIVQTIMVILVAYIFANKEKPDVIMRDNSSPLSISLDLNIIKSKYGDARKRQMEYARHFKHFTVIVLSSKSEHQKTTTPTRFEKDNLHVYATHSTYKPFAILRAVFLAKKLHQKYHFDIVTAQDPIATGITALICKKLFNTPLNLQLHSTYNFSPGWVEEYWLNRLTAKLIGKIVYHADSIRSVNKQIIEKIKQEGYLKKIVHVPIRVDFNYFFMQPKPKSKLQNLIAVGRLEKEKNHEMLLQAFKLVNQKYPSSHLKIVGGGSCEKALKDKIHSLGLKEAVSITGLVDQSHVKKYLHQADLFVLSSNYEGWSLVFAEAFAAGLPIVTTNVGSQKTLIRPNRNAKVVPVGDTQALSKAMIWMIDNPQKAFKFAKNGQKTVKELHSPKKVTLQWINLLKQTH